jgi:hypothetical protein
LKPAGPNRFRRIRLLVAFAVVALLFGFFLSRHANPEPYYEGTSVTDWTHVVSIANPEDQGVQALIAIGPAAVPYILKVYEGFGTKLQRSKLYSRVHESLPHLLQTCLPRPKPVRSESSKLGLLFVLGRIRPSPPAVEPFLAGELQSDIPGVRFYACESLRVLGHSSPQTTTNIVHLLRDPDPANRFCAIRTLVELKKLDRSMLLTLEQLAHENNTGWSNQTRALALFSLWAIGAPDADANFRNFLRTEPLQAIQWAIDPLKTDPHAAQIFRPYLLGRSLTSTYDREKALLNEALAALPRD